MSYIFKTSIGDEVPVTVEFDHQPAERADRPGEGAYPGCDEEVDIFAVEVDGDCTQCLLEVLSEKAIKDLETKCFEHLNSIPGANEPF